MICVVPFTYIQKDLMNINISRSNGIRVTPGGFIRITTLQLLPAFILG